MQLSEMVGMQLSCLKHQTVMPPTQVRFPSAARDFSPRVDFQCRLSYMYPYIPCVQSHAITSVCTLKILQSMSEFGGFGNTKTFSMHSRLSSVTLSQLAFPGESNPNFPWEKSHWDNTVVKSKKQKFQLWNASNYAITISSRKKNQPSISSQSILLFFLLSTRNSISLLRKAALQSRSSRLLKSFLTTRVFTSQN